MFYDNINNRSNKNSNSHVLSISSVTGAAKVLCIHISLILTNEEIKKKSNFPKVTKMIFYLND